MKEYFLKIISNGCISAFFLGLITFTVASAAVEYHPPIEGSSADRLLINVERDRKVGDNGKLKESNCPIELYINEQKVGDYFINEQQQYYISPGTYSLRVENCLGKYSIYDVGIDVNNSKYYQDYILSVDVKGKPFIIKNTPRAL